MPSFGAGAGKPGEHRGGGEREHRLDHQQPLDVAVAAERRAEQQRQQHPGEAGAGADRDPGGPLLRRQVVGGELADRVEDKRLGKRHRHLSRHRPGEGLAAKPQQAAEGDQRPAQRQRRAEAGVEKPPGG